MSIEENMCKLVGYIGLKKKVQLPTALSQPDLILADNQLLKQLARILESTHDILDIR